MKATVNRAQFIKSFMNHGLTYLQAIAAYEAMSTTFELAIINAAKINIGRVGCLDPEIKDPRTVNMGFAREGGVLKKVQRVFVMARRVTYRFRIYRQFKATHRLGWFDADNTL